MTWHSFKTAICSWGFIHFGQGKGILVSYSLAGNMHYTGERRFAIMENDALIAKKEIQNSLFTMLKNLQLN
jgi:hypothetical protein